MRNKLKNVVLAISGGIDSSVAALLLKKNGFNVCGLFMRNWDITDEIGNCSTDQDFQDAERTCSILGIPFHEVNFSKDYWNYVFTETIEQYQNGFTPNPDVLCNRYIKFNRFFDYCMEKFHPDAIATGHYAQTTFGNFLERNYEKEGVHLLKAVDTLKDQTFFLNQIQQKALQKVIFPLGTLKKSSVKNIALENNLDYLIKKKESTGICFIGRRNFSNFISEYLPDIPGLFINIDSGKVVGSHKGIHHFTIGQRCRISGMPERAYIVSKNPSTQEIFVALGRHHLSLWSQNITTSKPNWIHSVPDVLKRGGILHCDFRFQHTHPLTPCQVIMTEDGSLIINLKKPLFALTPGQYAVFYKGNECLGGSIITSAAPNLYSLSVIDKTAGNQNSGN